MPNPRRENDSTDVRAMPERRAGVATAVAQDAPDTGYAAGDSFAFLRGFLSNPRQVGSIVPSSRALERRLVRAGAVEHARSVVELGPGTGGTTRAFLRDMRPDARLLAIELSPVFHARLRDQIVDPRLHLHLGSAERIFEVLESWRMPRPDVVFSGIPFSTMPAQVAENISAGIFRALAPGGRFVAYQVRADVTRYLRPHLGEPQTSWEWINVPPLRVFCWTKPAG